MERSKFLKSLVTASAVPLIASPGFAFAGSVGRPKSLIHHARTGAGPARLKLSLNAYSFNEPLVNGTLTHDKLLSFCAEQEFQALDMTGYYFKGYPVVPSDETIFSFKRRAHGLGIAISGTGVRTDFTNDDVQLRNSHVKMVNEWIEVSAKLGAPVLRIFAGNQYPKPEERPAYLKMVVEHIQQCLPKAKSHGVILGIQNHYDFIRTSKEAIEILKAINSEWVGLILDTGSYRGEDPYAEIASSIPYAVNWQIKENTFINNIEQPIDLSRLFKIISGSDYRGYIPIETLGPGDPFQKVAKFVKEVKRMMNYE